MNVHHREFLNQCRGEAIGSFERLITRMKEADVDRVRLLDHPDYGFTLGVDASETESDPLEITHIELIPDFFERFQEYMRGKPSEPAEEPDELEEDEFIDTEIAWHWMHECWLAAGGGDSGRVVTVFENGLGDEIDLTTGEEPDDDDDLW